MNAAVLPCLNRKRQCDGALTCTVSAACRQQLTRLHHSNALLAPPGRLLTGLHQEKALLAPPGRLLISRQHLVDLCLFLQHSNSGLQTQLRCASQDVWELSESLKERGHQLLDVNKALTAVKTK